MPQGTGSDLRGLLATGASSPHLPAVNASGVAHVQLVPRGERGSGEGGGRGGEEERREKGDGREGREKGERKGRRERGGIKGREGRRRVKEKREEK